MIEQETAERPTLSKLAGQYPEYAFRVKQPERTFSLENGKPLYYWGSRNDLSASIPNAMGFGLEPQGDTKEEIAQAKKTQFPLINDCFFFLFSRKNGQTKVELLKLVSKPNANRLVFSLTGHEASF